MIPILMKLSPERQPYLGLPLERDKSRSEHLTDNQIEPIMDRLSCMAAFIKAVDTGSFAAASAQTGTSPQMVAKQVAHLEARLGTRLLHRTTRRQSLTEAGRLFLDRCREVLAAAEDAEALAAEFNATPRGHLRITAPSAFGRHSLMPVVTAFLRDHPDITVALSLTDRLVDLVDEGFEAAIRIGPIGPASLASRPLAPYRLLACASPSYLDRRGAPAAPAELATHELLSYAFPSHPAERAWSLKRGADSASVPVTGRIEVNDIDALIAAALDGFGIVLGPEDALSPALKVGRLVRVLPDYAAPTRPMNILYAPGRRQTPKLRRFIETVAERFGERSS